VNWTEGSERSALEWERKKFILKSERRILVFAIPHPFMDENFQFSEHDAVCVCQLATVLPFMLMCEYLCEDKFYRNFLLLRFPFFMFSVLSCVKFLHT
jgi:hypothetical protein